ncbi:MAG: hypothetical protein MUO53_18245 [Maribacter sp.]|nr:hypothetical protein [Maribacter sp.]
MGQSSGGILSFLKNNYRIKEVKAVVLTKIVSLAENNAPLALVHLPMPRPKTNEVLI